MKTNVVYLIHFHAPVAFRQLHGKTVAVRHYIGSAKVLEERMQAHNVRKDAAIMRTAAERGVGWEVVRTWEGDRRLERSLKRQGHFDRRCPKCRNNGTRH